MASNVSMPSKGTATRIMQISCPRALQQARVKSAVKFTVLSTIRIHHRLVSSQKQGLPAPVKRLWLWVRLMLPESNFRTYALTFFVVAMQSIATVYVRQTLSIAVLCNHDISMHIVMVNILNQAGQDLSDFLIIDYCSNNIQDIHHAASNSLQTLLWNMTLVQ